MREIGVGIIGWGFMGKTHAHALRSIPLYYPGIDFIPRIAAICSRDAQNAEAARVMMGANFSTGDYRELLKRPDVEVVSVCTPNGLHEEMTIAALEAGKHVYVDKPLSTDLTSAQRIAEGAGRAKGFGQMVLHNRFFPATMRAKQLVEECRIGEVLGFSCRYLHAGSIDPKRPAGWKQGEEGGVLLDVGSHALDLIMWLCGMPEEGFCAFRTLYPERPAKGGGFTRALNEDHALMTLRLKNGALGTVEATKIATGASDELALEIRGTRGAISWNLMNPNWLMFYDNTLPDWPLGGNRGFQAIECVSRYPAPGGEFLPSKNTIGWDRAHTHCYYSFLDSVVHGRAPSPSIADGARLQSVMDALKRSADSGAWVKI